MGLNNIHKLYLIQFLRALQFFGSVVIPYFLDWIGLDYTKIFLLQAWFVLWVVLLEVPTGILADKWGRKSAIFIGSLLFGLDLLISGVTRSYAVLYVAEFLGALGMAFFSGADKALLYDSLKEKKNARKHFARYEMMGTIGMVIAFPIGSIVAGSPFFSYPNSLALTMTLSGVASVIAALLCLTLKETKRKKREGNLVQLGISGLLHLKNQPALRAFAINSAIISGLTFFMFWFYQSLLLKDGVHIASLGFVGAGMNILGAVLLWNIKKIEKRVGVINLIFYSALIPGILFVALGFVANVWFSLFSIFLIIGLKLLRFPILLDFMNAHIEGENRATVLSIISLLERLVICIAYPIVGFLSDLSLDYAFIFIGGCIIIFTFITRIEERHLEGKI